MAAATKPCSFKPPTIDYAKVYNLAPFSQKKPSTCSSITSFVTSFFSTLFQPIIFSIGQLKQRGVKALVKEKATKTADTLWKNPKGAVSYLGKSFVQIKMPFSSMSFSLMKNAYRTPNNFWRVVFLTTIVGLCTLEFVTVAQTMFTDGVQIKGATEEIPLEFSGNLGKEIAKLAKCLFRDKKGMLYCSEESPLNFFSVNETPEGVIIGLPFAPEQQVCYLVSKNFDVPRYYELCFAGSNKNLEVYSAPIPRQFNVPSTTNPRIEVMFPIGGKLHTGEFPIEEFSFPTNSSKVSCVLIEDLVEKHRSNICSSEQRPEIAVLGPSPKGAYQDHALIVRQNNIRRTVIIE